MNATETTEVKLEQSGMAVVMKTYLTTGQSRQLQRLLMSGGEFDVTAGKFEGIPPAVYLDMQDKALEFLVVEIKDAEGKKVPFSMEVVEGLPIADGNKLYEEVNKYMEQSSLTDEQKKK